MALVRQGNFYAASVLALSYVLGASGVWAGDNNALSLLQISTGTQGNTLVLDQSEASGGLVAGDRLNLSPALQAGDGNRAEITFARPDDGANDSNTVLLTQGLAVAPGNRNEAIAVVSGLSGLVGIRQFGDDNSARVTVQSDSALLPSSGQVLQFGRMNDASLEVNGSGVSGTIQQFGNNNQNALEVSGTSTNVTFNQIGNNAVNPQATQVFTNAGNVTINQFSF